MGKCVNVTGLGLIKFKFNICLEKIIESFILLRKGQ